MPNQKLARGIGVLLAALFSGIFSMSAQSVLYNYDASGNLTSVVQTSAGAPSITVQPASQVLSQNGSVSFSVAAQGVGPLSYQWLSNGVPIVGATSDTLTVSNLVVPQNLVSNGGFELPAITTAFTTYAAGATNIPGWTIQTNNVDIVATYFMPLLGAQSLQLNGSTPGAISQELATVPGQTYGLRFGFSGNPLSSPITKTVQVWWNTNLVDTPSFNTTGYSVTNMGWTNLAYTLVATSTNSLLGFVSLTGGNAGPALDDVTVLPVISPADYTVVVTNSSGSATSTVASVEFDTIGNGLPNSWQFEYFGYLGVDPNGDADGSGLSNLQDFLDGTDPTNLDSGKPRLSLNATPGGTVSVTPLQAEYAFGQVVQVTAMPDAGNSLIGWYGSITNTNPAVSVVMNGSKTVTAAFGLPLAVALDAPELVWTTGGDALWFGQTATNYDGVAAGQSGRIVNNQQTWMQATVTNPHFTQLSFAWRTFTEGGDPFNFYTNGILVFSFAGNTGWNAPTYVLSPDSNTLYWNYRKGPPENDTVTVGDIVWVGDVLVVPTNSLSVSNASLAKPHGGTNILPVTVFLDHVNNETVTVVASTADGTALNGSDYLAENQTLIFGPGVATRTLDVPIIGNLRVETNKTFAVRLSSPVGAVLANSAATATIVTSDGQPGQLYNFRWAPVASPQASSVPFGVGISAVDASNKGAAYSGAASLGLFTNGPTANMLDYLPPTASGSGNYTVANEFIPDTNMVISEILAYFGSKVSIWRSDGVLVASQTNTNASGAWSVVTLTNPVVLLAGVPYRVAAFTGGAGYDYRSDSLNVFADGSMGLAYQGNGDAFPGTLSAANVRWWSVDLSYSDLIPAESPVLSPSGAVAFTNGVWTGNLTLTGVGTNLFLGATDNAGHSGFANPIAVQSQSQAQPYFDFSSGGIRWTDTGFNLQISGLSGQGAVIIYSSTNLVTWIPLYTNPPVVGTLQYLDSSSRNHPCQFYRFLEH